MPAGRIYNRGSISDLLGIHYYFNCGLCPFFATIIDVLRASLAYLQ